MPTAEDAQELLMDAADMERTLQRLARQVVEDLEDDDAATRMAIVGIHTRGVFIAARLKQMIFDAEGIDLPFGVLDATMYRDDYRMRNRKHVVRPTEINFDVSDRDIVLVDDVIFTGRTTRAGLDALTDLGRPASVRLLCLIDRGLRELPIRPDFVGRTVPTTADEEVRVTLTEVDKQDGVWLLDRAQEGVV